MGTKVYCVQLDCVWENKAASCAKVRALLGRAAPERGSLVLLPEMFATGFSNNVAGIREGEPPETELFLAALAKEFGVHLLGGVVTASADGKGRNQAVVFSPDGKETAPGPPGSITSGPEEDRGYVLTASTKAK